MFFPIFFCYYFSICFHNNGFHINTHKLTKGRDGGDFFQVEDYTKPVTSGGDFQKFFRNGGKIFELDTALGIQKYYRMYVGHNDFFIIFVYQNLNIITMAKNPQLYPNKKKGIDLIVDTEWGNSIVTATGNLTESLEFWKEVKRISDIAIDQLEKGHITVK